MNLRQERLLSRRSQLGRERFKCWNAWCSWHRQRHERGRYRCVALSLFTDPAVHHVRVQAMRQGHTTDAGPRLGTQGKYFCLELLAVFTPAWAVLIQRLFHRLHDPPSWGRCPLHAGSSRWDRRALTKRSQDDCLGYSSKPSAETVHLPYLCDSPLRSSDQGATTYHEGPHSTLRHRHLDLRAVVATLMCLTCPPKQGTSLLHPYVTSVYLRTSSGRHGVPVAAILLHLMWSTQVK